MNVTAFGLSLLGIVAYSNGNIKKLVEALGVTRMIPKESGAQLKVLTVNGDISVTEAFKNVKHNKYLSYDKFGINVKKVW